MLPNQTQTANPSIMKSIIIIACISVIFVVMYLSSSFLMPILMGLFCAIILAPINRWLIKKRVPAGLALLLSIGLLVVAALFLVWLLGDALTVLVGSLPDYGAQFDARKEELQATVDSLGVSPSFQEIVSVLSPENLTNVFGYILGAALALFRQGLLILFVTVFFLAEGPQMMRRISKAYGPDHPTTKNVRESVMQTIYYFGIRAVVNLIVAIATGIMLWIFNIPYVGLWMALVFFFSFVPYIGAIVAMIPPVLLAYAQGGLGLAIVIIVLAIVINGVVENLVAPIMMGKGLSVSPTVCFLSFMFWMFILGGSGAFIAMPLTVAIMLFMSSYEETRGLAAIMGTSGPND